MSEQPTSDHNVSSPAAPHAVQSLAWQHLHHISRETSDWEKSARFYIEVMGFQPIPRPAFRFAGAWLQRGNLQVHIIQGTSLARSSSISTTADHLAFQVPDIDEAKHQLDRLGVPYRVNVQSGTGLEQVFFLDPDGNVIELGNYAGFDWSILEPSSAYRPASREISE